MTLPIASAVSRTQTAPPLYGCNVDDAMSLPFFVLISYLHGLQGNTDAEVEKAYKKALAKFHPDRNMVSPRSKLSALVSS